MERETPSHEAESVWFTGKVPLVKHTVDNNGPVLAMISLCIHRGNVPHYDGIIYLKHLQESHNGSSASTDCDKQPKLHQVVVGQMQNGVGQLGLHLSSCATEQPPTGRIKEFWPFIATWVGVQVLSQLCGRFVCTCGGKGSLQVVG